MVAAPVQMGVIGPPYGLPKATLQCLSLPSLRRPPFPAWLLAFSRGAALCRPAPQSPRPLPAVPLPPPGGASRSHEARPCITTDGPLG